MNFSLDKKRFKLYLWIGLAWILLLLFINLVNFYETFLVRVPNEIWRAVYLIVLNFIFFEYALPIIRKKRKYILSWVLIGLFVAWAMLMLYSFGMYAWRSLGVELNIYTELKEFSTRMKGIAYHVQYSFFSMLFFGVIAHVYDYRRLKESAQQLQIEKQQAELNYLKSQTNPHFLFNTLNNIYSLARDKSDLAPESILRLSKILRFMLYETGGEYIAIEQELKIISDYIALEKLRYDDSLSINFSHDIEDMKQAIPPLLLIPLVENAFKHGVSETRGQPFVNIHLEVSKRQLIFVVKNSREEFSGETSKPEEHKENIGHANLRRQLQLLYKDYNLEIQQGSSDYTATLKINLASHV